MASKSRLIQTPLSDTTGSTTRLRGGEQIVYERSLVSLLGGPNGAILELQRQTDVDLLTALCRRHDRLKSFLEKRGHFFRREFDMTLDRHRFMPLKRAVQRLGRGDITDALEIKKDDGGSKKGETFFATF